MSTRVFQCDNVTLCAVLPKPVHHCQILPPRDPHVLQDVYSRIQQFKLTKPVWSDYTEECLGINGTATTTPILITTEAVSITQGETTSILQTVTQTITESVTNVTVIPNLDQGAAKAASSEGFDWVIPVAITIPILLVIAIIFVIYKTCQHAKSSSDDTTHPVDLQFHEDVNYLNNKAEVGVCWRMRNLDSVEANENWNNAPSGNTDVQVSTETLSVSNNRNSVIDSDNNTKLIPKPRENTVTTAASGDDFPSSTVPVRHKPVPSAKPAKTDGKKKSRKSKLKKQDTSVVYANHQFEKVASKTHSDGYDNEVFEGERFHKPLPPEPLVLPPLHRPLPQPPTEASRPIPTKRNMTKVSPS